MDTLTTPLGVVRVSLKTSLGDSFTSQHLRLLHCLYQTPSHQTTQCGEARPTLLSISCLETHHGTDNFPPGMGLYQSACWTIIWSTYTIEDTNDIGNN